MTRSPRLLAASLAALLLAGCTGVQHPGGPSGGADLAHTQAPDPGRTLRLAAASREGGDIEGAVRLYRRAIRQHPDHAPAYLQLADTLHAANAQQEALQTYATAARMAENPEKAPKPGGALHADALAGQGRSLIALRRPAEALQPLERALEMRPGHPTALNARGVALDLLGRHAQAQKIYRKLIADAPTHREARANLGLSLALAGAHTEAIDRLDRLVGEPGSGARARQNLAVAYALAGRYDAAAAVMRADLGERAVQNNLEYLDTVRFMITIQDPEAANRARGALAGKAGS